MSRNKREGHLWGLKVAPQSVRETDRKFEGDYNHEKEPCALSRDK